MQFPLLSVCLILLVLSPHLSPGHAVRPQRFHQQSEPIRGLFGSEIGDVVWSGRYLWVGTESGVARLDPSLNTGLNASDWVTYTERNGLGRGAISALDAIGDTVWVATLIDTVVGQNTFQADSVVNRYCLAICSRSGTAIRRTPPGFSTRKQSSMKFFAESLGKCSST